MVFLFSGYPVLAVSDDNEPIQDLDTMKVTGNIDKTYTLEIEEIEIDRGYQADVNTLLSLNPGVQKIPEAGSQLLVNGGSIFDNVLYINNVPLFIPAHFSGHFQFDINALQIPAFRDVKLITHSISGNYAGASNCAILVEPGIYSSKNNLLPQRLQLLVTFSNYDAGVSLKKEFRRGKDRFQLTANFPNWYLMAYKNARNTSFIWWDISYYPERDNPLWYEDFTFTGESDFGNVTLREYLWLALDAYSLGIKPWGVGSVTFENENCRNPWEVTAGGSRQYANFRNIVGHAVVENRVERENVSFFSEIKNIRLSAVMVDLSMRSEYLTWQGLHTTFQKNGNTVSSKLTQDEVQATVHAGLSHSRDQLSYGLDILGGGIVYTEPSLFVDPGVWGRLMLPSGSVAVQGGIQTSWPDIRGLPDSRLRLRQIKSYTGAMTFRYARMFDFLFETYGRWKEKVPIWFESPYYYRWDPEHSSSLRSVGICGEFGYRFNPILSTRILFDLNRTERKRGETYTVYEWDIPWSVKPHVQLTLMDERLSIHLSGTFTEGLPYHDVVLLNDSLYYSALMRRVPWYRRVDLKLQFDQPVKDHRFFTKFSAFVDIINIFDYPQRFKFGRVRNRFWENVREYYWNEYMIKKPVNLEHSTIMAGMRASFRL